MSFSQNIQIRRFRLNLIYMGFPGGSDSKESACNVGDLGLIPGVGRSPGAGHGNWFWYSYLENPHGQNSMVGYTVHGVSRVGYNWATKDSTAYIHTYIYVYAAAAAKLPQSRPTLCNPIDGSPPGSAIPGILQARILEWVAISFSNAWKWKVKVKSPSHVQLSNPMDCSPSGSSVFMYIYI